MPGGKKLVIPLFVNVVAEVRLKSMLMLSDHWQEEEVVVTKDMHLHQKNNCGKD